MGRYRNRSWRESVSLDVEFSGQWTLTRGLEPLCRTQKQKHYPALWSPDLSFSFHQQTSPSIKRSLSCTLSPALCARPCMLHCVWISVCKAQCFSYTSTWTIEAEDIIVLLTLITLTAVQILNFITERFLKGLWGVWPLTSTVILCSVWRRWRWMNVMLSFWSILTGVFFTFFHISSSPGLCFSSYFTLLICCCVYFKHTEYFWKQTLLSLRPLWT